MCPPSQIWQSLDELAAIDIPGELERDLFDGSISPAPDGIVAGNSTIPNVTVTPSTSQVTALFP